ncbi:MAG: triose-phosphate isomerase [Proteobacteria bacterium]|nr:triose-phosphate isomerase [Pseudomonadota bacterium]
MKLIAGNWKMNGTRADALKLAQGLVVAEIGKRNVEVAICPPFPLLEGVAAAIKGSGIHLGAQDCSSFEAGAYTGDVSAPMLKDLGCAYVILGHSERRAQHGENDALVKAKMTAAHKAGLKVILCVGEKDARMPEGPRRVFIKSQLLQSLAPSTSVENTVIAYEPVWAIGSGLTPSPEQISSIHAAIHGFLPAALDAMRVIYGGSVKADNALDIVNLAGVDGALPGGASLEAESFVRIVKAVK